MFVRADNVTLCSIAGVVAASIRGDTEDRAVRGGIEDSFEDAEGTVGFGSVLDDKFFRALLALDFCSSCIFDEAFFSSSFVFQHQSKA